MQRLLASVLLGLLACAPTSTTQSTNGVTVEGSVSDALYKTRVAGVEVCVVEPFERCTNTDPNGGFSFIDVAPHSRILLRFMKNGYYPNVAHYTVGDGNEFLTYLITSDELTDLAANLAQITRDDAKGHIIFACRTGKGPDAQNVSDLTVALNPVSGDGPFYVTMSGVDRSLTATTSAGGGIVFNVTPGTYTFTYNHASKTCSPYYGWAAEGVANALTVRVLEGFTTYVNQICQ